MSSLTGSPPDRHQNLVDLDLLRALGGLERNQDTVFGEFDGADPRLGVDIGTALGERLGQYVRGVAVRADRQDRVRKGLQQRGANTQIGVDRGEFGPDHTAADHRHPLRQFRGVAVGRVVGGDDSLAVDLEARQRAWHRTGADDHGLAGERLPLNRHRTGRGEGAQTVDHLDLAPLEQAREALVQCGDDAALALVDAGPVRRRARTVAELDAEVSGMADRPEHLGGMQ